MERGHQDTGRILVPQPRGTRNSECGGNPPELRAFRAVGRTGAYTAALLPLISMIEKDCEIGADRVDRAEFGDTLSRPCG